MHRSGASRARRAAAAAVRRLHPARVAGDIRRGAVFRGAMEEYLGLPAGADAAPELLERLVYGWGNEIMSAMPEYLDASVRAMRGTKGPVLECGSGLSTILLGALAERSGARLCSLEHDRGWAARVRRALRRYRLRGVEVFHAPLRDYGAFTWYDAPLDRLPGEFSLVVCDGPPGDTPGGRYGLLPVLRERLRPGCVILLDDLHRPAERDIASRWARELGVIHEVRGAAKPYAVIVAP